MRTKGILNRQGHKEETIPPKIKKCLHPKPLGSKSPSNSPHKIIKKNKIKKNKEREQNQTKPKKNVPIGMV
jgi:hypothetical protein